MVFNSYIFVLFFLPLTLISYFLLNTISRNLANLSLLGMSLWFYGYFNPAYLILLISSILVNYCLSKIMQCNSKSSVRKSILIGGLVFNIGILFYFKYYDFFINSINLIFQTSFFLKHLLLPLGISFFTFQQISYIVDCYKDKTIRYGLLEYSLFVSFFPQLVAGPIVLHNELIPQFLDEKKRSWNWESFAVGLMMFTTGLSKKVIFADSLGAVVDWGFTNVSSITSIDTWIIMISYVFQMYFDFSGYSDMAIGIGRMFNLFLPQNFNSPYRALSIHDFWKRWHMTLTRFLRTYIYFPLGGNRKGKLRTYFNIFVVYLVSGFWHGANWTFVLWGALNGIMIIAHSITKKQYEKINDIFKWMFTFFFWNVVMLLFRSESISQWGYMVKKLFLLDGMGSTIYLDDTFFKALKAIAELVSFPGGAQTIFSILVFPILVVLMVFICLKGKNIHERIYLFSKKSLIVTVSLLVICILSFSKESIFIYFNF